MRRFDHDERGAVAAEHVAAIVIVAALIAAVWSMALPQRVGEVAEVASDCLFQSDPERCEVGGEAAEGAAAERQAQDPSARTPGEPRVPPGGDQQLPDQQVVDGSVEEIAELLDGGWPQGVTSGDLDEVIDLLTGLADDELDAVFDQLSAEQRRTLLDEVFGHNRLARWRNLSEDEQARFANDVLARLSPEQLTRLDREQLADDMLPLLDADQLRRTLDAVDFSDLRVEVVDDGHVADDHDHVNDPEDFRAVADGFWEYLYLEFGRDSLDGEGGPMIGEINSGAITRGNAHWHGGDELTRYRPGAAVESVIIHELAHGLVYYMVDIDTREIEGQALNEAIADIFSMNITRVGTFHHDSPDEIVDGAARIPENPSDHPQNHPAHTRDYDPDAMSGHFNSTIISHAYWQMTEDIGWEASEQILFGALDGHLDSDAGFEHFRTAMLDAADERYGTSSDERAGVERAFDNVGLDGTWESDDGS